jgi:hypothetical protein
MAKSDREMVNYARDCMRLAQLTTDTELQLWLLRVAREWIASMHEEKTPAPGLEVDRMPTTR